jgi:hypothetical protein
MPDQVSDRRPNSNTLASIFGLDPERISPYVLGILIVYAILRNLFQAATKPFWYDELCTFILVRQQRLSTMWSALAHGADGNPPGFYLAERFASALLANENIAFRWLSILGFSCVLVSLFQLIRERRGSVIALFCASTPRSCGATCSSNEHASIKWAARLHGRRRPRQHDVSRSTYRLV